MNTTFVLLMFLGFLIVVVFFKRWWNNRGTRPELKDFTLDELIKEINNRGYSLDLKQYKESVRK